MHVADVDRPQIARYTAEVEGWGTQCINFPGLINVCARAVRSSVGHDAADGQS